MATIGPGTIFGEMAIIGQGLHNTFAEAIEHCLLCVTNRHDVERLITFQRNDDKIIDEETGSTWNILGRAIDGPLAGKKLTPVVHADHFWFSWAAFKPDTIIYGR